MGPYLISLFAGVLVGAIYAIMRVRSPAPPLIALVGLLGILIGENFFPMVQEKLFPRRSQVEERNKNGR